MKGRRLVSLVLTFSLVFGMSVQASSISETKKKGEELQSQKSAAEAEQSALAQQLNTLITEMDQAAEDIQKKHEEISEKEDELIQAQIDENNQYESMKLRIKYMYENGNTQFFETLLESKSIGDFLNKAEYITQISEYDRNMLVEFQNTVKLVDEQKEALEEEQAELEALQEELQAKEAEVSTLLEEKADEISNLEAAIGENAAKLKELQEEAARQARLQQEATIVDDDRETYTPSDPIPPSGNGVLSNPCPSAYISSEFGGRASPGGIGSTNHKGRDYAAGAGTPIYAAASGSVTTVANSAARGNYVVINHGNGLATLYQHCSAIYVREGQSVSVGQNIAAVGSTGYSTGPHLHFEVHVNGTPVDPRLYL